MLQKMEILGIHHKPDEKLHKYTEKKIGRLDRFLPRASRASAHMTIRLQEDSHKTNSQCTCEATLHLPKQTISLKESTVNMYAAVDIIEVKLKHQIKKYKELHGRVKLRQRMLARMHSDAPQVS